MIILASINNKRSHRGIDDRLWQALLQGRREQR
jgi:hypothetical protein